MRKSDGMNGLDINPRLNTSFNQPNQKIQKQYNVAGDFYQIRIELKRFKTTVKELKTASNKQIERTIKALSSKYDDTMYVSRSEAEQKFWSFLTEAEGSMIIIGKSGCGKTNVLCYLASQMLQEGAPLAVFLTSAALTEEKDIQTVICSELLSPVVGGHLTEEEVVGFYRELLKHSIPLVVFIDGINEVKDIRWMRQILTDAFRQFAGTSVKFCITCRDIFWREFRSDEWIIYEPDREREIKERVNAAIEKFPKTKAVSDSERERIKKRISRSVPRFKYTCYLDDFDEFEFQKAIKKYDLTDRLAGQALRKCKHPLLLRLLADSLPSDSTEIFRELVHLDLFDKYWASKVSHLHSTDWEATPLVAGILFCTAQLMEEQCQPLLQASELESALEKSMGNESWRSVLKDLISENVILQQEVSRDSIQIRFTYDEFLEYVLARKQYKELNWAHKNDEFRIIIDAKELISKTKQFRLLEGTLTYMILMLDQYNAEMALHVLTGLIDEPTGRDIALRCITKITHSDNYELLKTGSTLLSDKDPARRAEAVSTLANLAEEHRESVFALLGGLTPNTDELRDSLIHIYVRIAHLPDTPTFERLFDFCLDRDIKVQEAAVFALRDLVKNFPEQVKAVLIRLCDKGPKGQIIAMGLLPIILPVSLSSGFDVLTALFKAGQSANPLLYLKPFSELTAIYETHESEVLDLLSSLFHSSSTNRELEGGIRLLSLFMRVVKSDTKRRALIEKTLGRLDNITNPRLMSQLERLFPQAPEAVLLLLERLAKIVECREREHISYLSFSILKNIRFIPLDNKHNFEKRLREITFHTACSDISQHLIGLNLKVMNIPIFLQFLIAILIIGFGVSLNLGSFVIGELWLSPTFTSLATIGIMYIFARNFINSLIKSETRLIGIALILLILGVLMSSWFSFFIMIIGACIPSLNIGHLKKDFSINKSKLFLSIVIIILLEVILNSFLILLLAGIGEIILLFNYWGSIGPFISSIPLALFSSGLLKMCTVLRSSRARIATILFSVLFCSLGTAILLSILWRLAYEPYISPISIILEQIPLRITLVLTIFGLTFIFYTVMIALDRAIRKLNFGIKIWFAVAGISVIFIAVILSHYSIIREVGLFTLILFGLGCMGVLIKTATEIWKDSMDLIDFLESLLLLYMRSSLTGNILIACCIAVGLSGLGLIPSLLTGSLSIIWLWAVIIGGSIGVVTGIISILVAPPDYFQQLEAFI